MERTQRENYLDALLFGAKSQFIICQDISEDQENV